MRRRLLGPFLLSLLAAAGMLWALPVDRPPATQPATQPALSGEQLDFARRPISYFNANCGSCHGNYGSFWGEGFAAELTDHALRDIVDEMAAGPSQKPLEGLALDVQVAYHRSLVDQKPFVTAYLEDGQLRGEVTPGSEVVVVAGGREHAATVEKHAWRSELREASQIRVTHERRQTALELSGSERPPDAQVLHSHAASSKHRR